jgi:ribonuclease HI
MHKSKASRKTMKGNQIIVLTESEDQRILQSTEDYHSKSAEAANLGCGTPESDISRESDDVKSDLVAYVDGGCLGNPGPSGIGVVIQGCESGPIRIAKWIGNQDNNVAEYAALMEALQYAVALNARKLHVYSDSQVVVRQMTGEYTCRSPRLYSLHWTCRKLARALKFSISHVPRENNAEANRLAQSALKRKNKGSGGRG